MEQGSGTIECVDPSSPHWNDSEPVCKGKFQGWPLAVFEISEFGNMSTFMPAV